MLQLGVSRSSQSVTDDTGDVGEKLDEEPTNDISDERLDDVAELGHEVEESVRNDKVASDGFSKLKSLAWNSIRVMMFSGR